MKFGSANVTLNKNEIWKCKCNIE